MSGTGFWARVLHCGRLLRTSLARPFRGKRTPSPEVQKLKRELARVERDDVKLRDLTRRKEKILRDNHLVSDVERALGLRS